MANLTIHALDAGHMVRMPSGDIDLKLGESITVDTSAWEAARLPKPRPFPPPVRIPPPLKQMMLGAAKVGRVPDEQLVDLPQDSPLVVELLGSGPFDMTQLDEVAVQADEGHRELYVILRHLG